jgi:hypothetical protein
MVVFVLTLTNILSVIDNNVLLSWVNSVMKNVFSYFMARAIHFLMKDMVVFALTLTNIFWVEWLFVLILTHCYKNLQVGILNTVNILLWLLWIMMCIYHYMMCYCHYMGWSWSYGSWIYNYICNQCISPLMLWVRIPLRPSSTQYNIM